MTGLVRGPAPPILQGYLPNFVFMITCERSPEKGLSKEKLEEEIEGKISHGFSGIGGILAGPNRQAQKHSKRPEGTWLRKKSPLSKK